MKHIGSIGYIFLIIITCAISIPSFWYSYHYSIGQQYYSLYASPPDKSFSNFSLSYDLNLSNLYAKYYKNHLESFHGEDASTQFKISLTSFLQKQKITSISIVDVGANKGQIFEFDWISNSTKKANFLLIEPNPSLHSKIETVWQEYKQKIGSKTKYNCQILNYALTSKYTTNQSMIFRVNKYNSELSRLVDLDHTRKKYVDRTYRAWSSTAVDIVTLDWILSMDNYRQITFGDEYQFKMLKIDTEGFDVTVLFGAYKSISKFDIILFECSIGQVLSNHGPGTSIYSSSIFLEQHLFDVYKLGTKISIPLNLKYYNPIYDAEEYMDWQNCVAINRKSYFYHELNDILCQNCHNDALCSLSVC